MATLCGCVAIVYPIEGITKNEWTNMNWFKSYLKFVKADYMYGIAYGIDDLDFAEKTIHLAPQQWKDVEKFYKETYVKSFLEDINNFDYMNNTVQNNYFFNDKKEGLLL
jgi:hypothetical protein